MYTITSNQNGRRINLAKVFSTKAAAERWLRKNKPKFKKSITNSRVVKQVKF